MDSSDETIEECLKATLNIDFYDEMVAAQAKALAHGATGREAIARRCFEWVRDEIAHSLDIDTDRVTCRASEVLHEGHGLCYAKSHLLAALLRANAIPAAFGYQRLDDGAGGFVLHGYTAIHLDDHGWYRVDPRGNVGGIDAHFDPPRVRLAWPANGGGEIDYGVVSCEPVAEVVRALRVGPRLVDVVNGLHDRLVMG